MNHNRNSETTRPVIIKGQKNLGTICPPGHEYCFQCGQVAISELFLKEGTDGRCPNPNCPDPENWDD